MAACGFFDRIKTKETAHTTLSAGLRITVEAKYGQYVLIFPRHVLKNVSNESGHIRLGILGTPHPGYRTVRYIISVSMRSIRYEKYTDKNFQGYQEVLRVHPAGNRL